MTENVRDNFGVAIARALPQGSKREGSLVLFCLIGRCCRYASM